MAVLRLSTNMNFEARSIGRSAGLAPLSILSTITPAWRNVATKFDSVAHQPTCLRELDGPNRQEMPLCRQRRNGSEIGAGDRVVAGLDSLRVSNFHLLEGAHDFAQLPQPEWLQFDIERLRGCLHCPKFRSDRRIVRIQDDAHTGDVRHHFLEQLDSFCPQLRIEEALTRDVSARPRDAGDDARCDRVADQRHHDGDRRGCLLAARLPGVACVMITSTLERTSSAASCGSRS